jgi:hypothetical protein
VLHFATLARLTGMNLQKWLGGDWSKGRVE